jgi:DNA-binding NarL/FixJ family response regulator
MNIIKVLIVDDHTIVRQGLCALLNAEKNIEVIGEAENGWEVVELTKQLKPDVIVMDISMPKLNGIETMIKIKKESPDTAIIMLSMHSNKELIFQVLRAGASGYLVKNSASSELISAIKAAHKGESYLDSSISKKVIDEYLKYAGDVIKDSHNELTDREREVLQLLAEGRSKHEIANILFISSKTVDAHKVNLMKKLNLHNLAELTKYAISKGIVDSDVIIQLEMKFPKNP